MAKRDESLEKLRKGVEGRSKEESKKEKLL